MLLNKYYVIVHGLKITSLFKKKKKSHARGPRIQGGGEHVKIHARGSTHSGGWGTRKNSVPIPRGVHAA